MSRAAIVPFVVFRTPDGRRLRATPGSIVGRMQSAAVRLDSPVVSEAHALVSLRGTVLKLVRLGGPLVVEGRSERRVTLVRGQTIELGPKMQVVVEAIGLPDQVWVLTARLSGVPPRRVPLVRSRYSVLGGPAGRVEVGTRPDAAMHLWTSEDHWRCRLAGCHPIPLTEGPLVQVGGLAWFASREPIRVASVDNTQGGDEFLHLECSYDIVTIHRLGRPPLVLNGLDARIVSELAQVNQPVAWRALGRAAWGRHKFDKLAKPRASWDTRLGTLRQKLRDADIRSPFLLSDGCGNIHLLLHPGDKVTERS